MLRHEELEVTLEHVQCPAMGQAPAQQDAICFDEDAVRRVLE